MEIVSIKHTLTFSRANLPVVHFRGPFAQSQEQLKHPYLKALPPEDVIFHLKQDQPTKANTSMSSPVFYPLAKTKGTFGKMKIKNYSNNTTDFYEKLEKETSDFLRCSIVFSIFPWNSNLKN